MAHPRVDLKLNDLGDLVRVLMEFGNAEKRRKMGLCGARKMAQEYSWATMARRRMQDFEAALHFFGRTKHVMAAQQAKKGEAD